MPFFRFRIQGRRRLVCNHESRLTCQRLGYGHTLLLPAAKLVWISVIDAAIATAKLHPIQKTFCFLPAPPESPAAVRMYDFRDLPTHLHDRAQRLSGILPDSGNLRPANSFHFALRKT